MAKKNICKNCGNIITAGNYPRHGDIFCNFSPNWQTLEYHGYDKSRLISCSEFLKLHSFKERFSLEDPCSNLLCRNENNENCEECSCLVEWSRVK